MKNYKRGIMSTVIALGLCVVMGVSGFAAETIEDAEREAQILEAEREAAQAGRNVLDAQLNEIIEDMMETTEQLRLTSDAVVAAEFELVDALVDENNQYQNMKRRIQFMYENGGFRMLEMLFSSESLGEFVNQVEYINMITTADRDMLVQFQDTVDRVVVKEAALREEEEVLVELQDELIEQQETVQELLVEADVQLEDLHAKIGANYAVLADLIAQAEAERILQEQAAEAARLQEEQARAVAEEAALQAQAPANQENGNDYNGENANGNGNEAPPPPPPADGGDFLATGQLFHPLPGNTGMSSGFGWRAFDNAHHNGVDWTAPIGTPIFAAESGTVITSGFSHSAGNWIVINHGGGMTTIYMHNSVNQVSVGQQVARGEQIALVGSTGFSTGPHLHFEVRINGTPHNPLNFL